MASKSIQGNLVDVHQRRIYPAEIIMEGDRILSISELPSVPSGAAGNQVPYILPGFIDAHVHIESSMLVPSQFGRLAVVHGTVATVSDPHEISNVCGMEGIDFMIRDGKTIPFKFNFGAPSCVPATSFETAGAVISADDIHELMQQKDILYLSEMMNFPGVLQDDADIKKKIAAAKQFNKPVDGHAPGLRGEPAKKYIDAGISTDHECFTADEGRDKLKHGMKILIREGSAAKNFEALIELLHDHAEMIMFCSDDKHPDSLVEGHINTLCARAAAKGIDLFKILQAACVNPVNHYKLKVGLLRQNDFADFILVKDLEHFEVIQTWINGELVAENGVSLIQSKKATAINQFKVKEVQATEFKVPFRGQNEMLVIEALDGQLITNKITIAVSELLSEKKDELMASKDADILKIAVINRYQPSKPAVGFIKNFGLKRGAIASSVAHDSHNIVVVGVSDADMAQAANLVIRQQGGISCTDGHTSQVLPLPVAGLMSTEDGYEVARQYASIDAAAKALGSTLSAPFMTLSFMALLVIPHLKMSDMGLFDGQEFRLIADSFEP
jgi:adenine deaminase